MKIVQRPVSGLLAVVLGVAALMVSLQLLLLQIGGWPWTTTVSSAAGGPTTVEIVADGGARYQFTGTAADARHWLDQKQDDLMEAHAIPTKITVGRVLRPVGIALIAAGIAQLLWLWRGRTKNPAAAGLVARH